MNEIIRSSYYMYKFLDEYRDKLQ